MALDTFVEGASSEELETSLRYLVPQTSSAIVSSRAATIFSAGGDSYSPDQGVRAITFRVQGSGGAAGGEYLDLESLFFKANYQNTTTSDLNFHGPAWCAFSRVTVRLSSTVVEDVQHFGRLYSMLHALSPAEEKKNSKISAGDATTTLVGQYGHGVFGFDLTPLALCRSGVMLPLSLAPLEITMELVPQSAMFADQTWLLQDCQLLCTIKVVDQEVSSKIHAHTVGHGLSLPIVLPGCYFCTDQVSSENATIHLSKSVSRATALFCTYYAEHATHPSYEVVDFIRPQQTSGTWELLLNSRRYPDRALAWNDSPTLWHNLRECMGRGPLNISHDSFTVQTEPTTAAERVDAKNFIIGIDLTKSPTDGVAGGETSFTGEHMRTSLATIQQKECKMPTGFTGDRMFLVLRYDAIVEVSAGGVDLLT